MPTDNPDNGNQFESSDQQDYLAVNVYDTITIENSLINIFTPPSGYYDLPNYTKGRLASTAFRTRQTGNWSYKYYRYDERGRVKTMWQMIDGLEVKTMSYEYNSQDQITASIYNSGIDFKRYRYRYDNAARLQAVDTYDGPEPSDDPLYYQSFADYEYNPNSFIITQNFLGGYTGSSLGYDNRGRITSSYAHNSEFIYSLSYLKNSNVLQQELFGSYRDYFANTEDLVYKFTYDKSNRLLSATNTAGSPNEYEVENTYDKDGNILTLKRYVNAGAIQDDFAYQYYSGTNKLRKVTGSTDQYQYDLNGNVTTDSLNKNTSAVYDHRNLLIEIYHKRGTPPARIEYFATRYYYDESGNRVRKLTYKNNNESAGPVLDWNNTSDPGNNWTLFNNEHYVRGVDGKELATYTNNSLDEWYVWGTDMVGKMKGSTKYYFFKDHLGSIRAVVDNNFNLISATDYDAWGDKMQGRIYNGDSTKFGFTGKEQDDENLYDYFGARYYDSRIGRWGQVEPLLDKYLQVSPYSYSFDNPLRFLDPNGKDAIPIFYLKYRIESSGKSIPYIGHVGVLLINNKSGETVYYDYGRYGENGKGIVRRRYYENVMSYKYEGLDQSKISNVLKIISSDFGKGSEIAGAYIESDRYDEMKNWAEDYYNYTRSANSFDAYNVLTNSCTSFCYDLISQDKEHEVSEYLQSPFPADLLRIYQLCYKKVSFDEVKEEYQFER
jgi:RHS repeat-associated protein